MTDSKKFIIFPEKAPLLYNTPPILCWLWICFYFFSNPIIYMLFMSCLFFMFRINIKYFSEWPSNSTQNLIQFKQINYFCYLWKQWRNWIFLFFRNRSVSICVNLLDSPYKIWKRLRIITHSSHSHLNIIKEILALLKCFPKQLWIFRSNLPEVFLRKGVPKIYSKFIGEHPCRSVILIKLQSNFIEITLEHGCYPVNLLHILRTPFYKNTSGVLLLYTFFRRYRMVK